MHHFSQPTQHLPRNSAATKRCVQHNNIDRVRQGRAGQDKGRAGRQGGRGGHAGRKAHLAVAGHRAEGNLPELLLHERAVRNAADGHAVLGEHDGVVVPVEHEADDVLLRHLGQLLVEDLLESVGGRNRNKVAKRAGLFRVDATMVIGLT